MVRLAGLVMRVRSVDAAGAFYSTTLGLQGEGERLRLGDGLFLDLVEGRPPCSAREPHGAVPAFLVSNLSQAKGWLQHTGCPIVFEEVVPGLARLAFLDPDDNAIELVEERDPEQWVRGAAITASAGEASPAVVEGVLEVSIFANDTAGVLSFYRDVLSLPVGAAYFAHVHLMTDNVPLVLRPTWCRCGQAQPHTPGLVLEGVDLGTLAERCRQLRHRTRTEVLGGQQVFACRDPEHTWLYWAASAVPPGNLPGGHI